MNKSPLSETEWNIIKVVWAQVARSAGEIIEALDAPFRRVKRLPSQPHRQAAPIRLSGFGAASTITAAILMSRSRCYPLNPSRTTTTTRGQI